ncbi:alpha-xylosidase [gut metagenome]|uniref:Alpha-xylosidase n=1 Tax=gut metagenome TaxID=749906 RepID=J9GIU0_9ZZZZ
MKAKPGNVCVKITSDGPITTYQSSLLTVQVNTKVGQITFLDSQGNVLLKEGGYTFSVITDGPDKGRFKVSQEFALEKEEPVYGVGLLQNGKMNQRGEHRLMIQSNLEDYAHFFLIY